MKPKAVFLFKKTNKIKKPLARLRKAERGHKLLISELKAGTSPQFHGNEKVTKD